MKIKFSARIVTLTEIYNACHKLAQKLNQASLKFDAVIAIARGGFPCARFICDFLNIHTLYSMQITHYAGGGQEKGQAIVKAPVNADIKGKRILIMDDVNDSGKTLQAARDYVTSLHPESCTIAVLHEKAHTVFKADFAAHYQKQWKWLIYQWAVTEDVLAFLKNDNMLNANEAEIRAHLLQRYGLKINTTRLRGILQMKESYA